MVFRYWVGVVGLLVILGVVSATTLTPATVDTGYKTEIELLLAWFHQHGLPAWFGYRHLEFSANVLMFVPLGFFAGLLTVRQWWVAALALPLSSALIEGIQMLFLPGRYATVSDVIANSLGGWAGLSLAVLVISSGWFAGRRLPPPGQTAG